MEYINNIIDYLVKIAESFMNLFTIGGEEFIGFVTGILPTLIVLITFVNSVIKIIGEEKVDRFALFCSKNFILRYTLLPFVCLFVLCNPMAYAMGKFMKEEHKPAFYDAAVSFCHPILGLFPHVNPSEYFVFGGIAMGVTSLGLSVTPLAVRYFLAGLVIILIRGIVTERLTKMFMKKEENKVNEIV